MSKIFLTVSILTIFLFIGWSIVCNLLTYARSGVFEMNITLNDVTLRDINGSSKNIEYYGNRLVVDDGVGRLTMDDVGIRGRGNMSWLADKKSYKIKLPSKINLFGRQKTNKVALIPNGSDDTFLRNDLAHYIARIIDDEHPVDGDFVDLSVNGEYIGLYYVVSPISIGKNGVDLRDSRGVLAELDNAYCSDEKRWRIIEESGDCIAIMDVVSNNKEALDAEEYFFNSYELFESAVFDGDFERASLYADMDSWAGYYLVGEFAANLDMAVTSLKLYKDGLEDKIHAVMVWDFDWSFGNKNWDDARNPRILMTRYRMLFPEKIDYEADGGSCRFELERGSDEARRLLSPMPCYLVDMPEFRRMVAEIYQNKLQDRRWEILGYIRDKAISIRESAVRDNEKWNKRNFDDEVEYLIWWVNERFDYFDEVMVSY